MHCPPKSLKPAAQTHFPCTSIWFEPHEIVLGILILSTHFTPSKVVPYAHTWQRPSIWCAFAVQTHKAPFHIECSPHDAASGSQALEEGFKTNPFAH